MIILGVPVPVKYIHETIFDWIRCATLRKQKEHLDAKFSFVYFSYQPDFEYLRISITSLLDNVGDDYIGAVHLFEDQKAKFNDNELLSLRTLCPKLVVHPVNNFSWASPESTLAEIECFLKVASVANDIDMVVKVDSDILFLESDKLVRLLQSASHAVGDGHSEKYRFAQGGLYMIRSKLIKSVLSKVKLSDVLKIVETNNSSGEDRAISKILEINQKPFHFTRLMLFPTEYRRVKKLSRFNRWDFCAAHFVRDKENMEKYYEIFKKS